MFSWYKFSFKGSDCRLRRGKSEYATLEPSRERTCAMVSQEDYLEDLYGPLARFSEHKRGDTISYKDVETGLVKTGTIIWVQQPAKIGDRDVGLSYMVEPP